MPENNPLEQLRLNKFIALQLGISRREADLLIEKGQVNVDGQTATLGARYTKESKISVRGKELVGDTELKYIALNKPVGYVCSRRQQGDAPTIYSILPKSLHNLNPVGRLDKNTSGLILLTNDGDFAQQMTHPRYTKTKQYLARLDKDLEPLHQQMISDFGVNLEDGPSRLTLERLNDNSRREWKITMSEGRNRQIRRTFSSLGYTVIKLHRTHFGDYSLGDIKPGKYITLNIQ
jgi:23S rRNA pseudouridine2605 synthase